MKRIAMLVLVCLMMASCALADVPAKPETYAHVYNCGANVFLKSHAPEIEKYGQKLEEETGIQLIAVAVNSFDGMDPADFAAEIIEEWGIGQQSGGAVVVYARGDRGIQIRASAGLEHVFAEQEAAELISRFMDDFARNNSVKGIVSMYVDLADILAKAHGIKGFRFRIENKGMIEEMVITFFVCSMILYIAIGIYLIKVIKGRGLYDGFEKRLASIYNYIPLIMIFIWIGVLALLSESGYVTDQDAFFENTAFPVGIQLYWWIFYIIRTNGIRRVLLWFAHFLVLAASEDVSSGKSRGGRSGGGSRGGGSSRGGGGGRSF